MTTYLVSKRKLKQSTLQYYMFIRAMFQEEEKHEEFLTASNIILINTLLTTHSFRVIKRLYCIWKISLKENFVHLNDNVALTLKYI